MIRSWGERVFRLIWPWPTVLFVSGFLFVAILLAANGVDTTVTDDDRQVIAQLDVDEDCAHVHNYDSQLACITAVQTAIFERYPDTSDAFERGVTDHSTADYDARGYGSCYDRATLIEQTLRHYGFNVRRVALYEKQPTPLHYLIPGIRSHALSEVHTSQGWMVVESIDPLLGVDDSGKTYSIADIRQGLQANTVDDQSFNVAIPDDFFDGQFAYIYGVHSRHGYFFEPHLPVPEVDWANFGR